MVAELNQLKVLIKGLVAAYPNAGISPDTTTIYARMLTDIPVDLLQRAIEDQIATNKFFPTIAEIRASAQNVTESIKLAEIERSRQQKVECTMCDENGFRYINVNGVSGVK